MQCNITEGQNLYQFIKLAKSLHCTGLSIMFSMITNIYNNKTTLKELFTAREKLKKFFLTTRDV